MKEEIERERSIEYWKNERRDRKRVDVSIKKMRGEIEREGSIE